MNSKSRHGPQKGPQWAAEPPPAVELKKYCTVGYRPLIVTVTNLSSQTVQSLPNIYRMLHTSLTVLRSIDESHETKACVRY